MRSLFLLLPVLIACSSNKQSGHDSSPNVPIANPFFLSPVIIYLLDGEQISESDIYMKAETALIGFKRSSTVPDSITVDGFQISSLSKGDEEFMELHMNELADTFLKLTEQEANSLEGATHSIQIVFFGTNDNVVAKQYKINQFIHQIAFGKKVAVVDLSTFDFFNASSWKVSRVDPFEKPTLNIASQVTIHTYREDAMCRAVTLGMSKFCLPDISIKRFACSESVTFGSLINATIQTLMEHPFIYNDSTVTIDLNQLKNAEQRELLLTHCQQNAKKVVNIKLKTVAVEPGDIINRQFLISFQHNGSAPSQEEGSVVTSTLFGSEESFIHTEHDDELLAASERARQHLPELKKKFNAGLEPGYSLMVKSPFKTDAGGNEWMWVEVTRWTDTQMEGILQNDPFEVSNLKAGAHVEINESEIFDYILNKPDGSSEGNGTGEILARREN